MNRDTPNYENIAKSVKTEMTDFVSYYRSVRPSISCFTFFFMRAVS